MHDVIHAPKWRGDETPMAGEHDIDRKTVGGVSMTRGILGTLVQPAPLWQLHLHQSLPRFFTTATACTNFDSRDVAFYPGEPTGVHLTVWWSQLGNARGFHHGDTGEDRQ